MSLSLAGSIPDPPTSRLQLSTTWTHTVEVRITAVGDVDMSTAHWFTDYVLREATGCRELLLDMSQVTFFDCAGLSALDCIEERCRTAQIKLNIEPAQCVSRVMTLCESLCA